LFSHLTYLVLQHYLAKEESWKTMHCCIVHTTVQLLQHSQLPFSWTMPSNSSKLNALITRCRESYSSVSMSRKSKSLKKSSNNWLNSGNALIEHLSENAIFLFPVMQGSAEAQVTWGGTVKHLLIAYIIGNISAKKYQNPFTRVKLMASQVWRFLRHGVCDTEFHVSQLHHNW